MLRRYLLFCTTWSLLFAQDSQIPKSSTLLKHEINKIVQPVGRKAAVGIKIISLKNDQCIYQKNAEQLFKPASNTKLFTGAAALEVLSPEARFETQLLTDHQFSSTKINNLYIKGGGDPTLKTVHLEEMVKKLRARGVKEIRGNIVIDASIFDAEPRGPGWNKADGPIFDKSPVNGLMLNHSCITVRVKPARIPGHKPQIVLDPAVDYITIENKARTTLTAKKHSLHVFRAKKTEKKITITGKISTKTKQKAFLIVLDHPELYTAHVLANLLKKHKISYKGSVIVGKAPRVTPMSRDFSKNEPKKISSRRLPRTTPEIRRAKLLIRHHSKPVQQIVRHMMKKSDNLYADALFKKMAVAHFGEPGTWDHGKKVLDAFLLDEVGFKLGDVRLFDGCGLSHNNRVSPNHIAQLLSWVYHESLHKNLFMDSLPISGIDGSLKHRMRNKMTKAKVKAKTGNLPGVTSLAGYITPKKGNPLLFVILVNRKNKSALEFKRKLEDHLCTLLATHAFSIS